MKRRQHISVGNIMRLKKIFIKIFSLILCIIVGCGTLSGCGVVAGGATAQELGLGTFYSPHKPDGSGACFVFDSSLCDGGKKCTAPVGAFTTKPVPKKKAYKDGSLSVTILHIAGHVMVVLNGGSSTCGDYCPLNGTSMQFTPSVAFDKGKTVGADLAEALPLEDAAMVVLLAVWAANMLMLVVQERFTMEGLLKSLCQLVIGIFVISNAGTIVSAFMSLFGNGGSMQNTSFGDELGSRLDADANVLLFALNVPILKWSLVVLGGWIDNGAFDAIFCGILPAFAAVKCSLSVFSAVALAEFEVQLRLKAAPILFAISSQTGWGQTQIGYLKQCMGAAAQVAIIGALSGVANGIDFGINGGLFAQGVAQMISYMIIGGLISQVGNVTHQVFGH